MKGIILAGGMGSRLAPLTQSDNKHFLPVYQRRMIEYPINTLTSAGITDVVLITGGRRPGVFLEYLKDGSKFGIERLYYTHQEGAGGIPAALKLAKPFLEPGESCAVILGDNYFEDGIANGLTEWNKTRVGAHIFLKEVDVPFIFGIAQVDKKTGKVIHLEEKPKVPRSNLAILGGYVFDNKVWEYIESLEPSARGELEITGLLECYMHNGTLGYSTYSGYWNDMGSFESWMEVSKRVCGLCKECQS